MQDTRSALTIAEHSELMDCEAAIERGLGTFREVGDALLRIRDAKLYRLHAPTFEAYCRDRWGISQPRAYQFIEAAEAVGRLESSTNVELPANEAQVRPLTRLGPEQQAEVWRQATETAPDGKVTAAHVQQTVDAYRGITRLPIREKPPIAPPDDQRDAEFGPAINGSEPYPDDDATLDVTPSFDDIPDPDGTLARARLRGAYARAVRHLSDELLPLKAEAVAGVLNHATGADARRVIRDLRAWLDRFEAALSTPMRIVGGSE